MIYRKLISTVRQGALHAAALLLVIGSAATQILCAGERPDKGQNAARRASDQDLDRVRQAGREILKELPADETERILRTLVDGMKAHGQDEGYWRPCADLLEWLAAGNGATAGAAGGRRWGEPVSGVQVALRAEKLRWQTGQPPKFTTETRKGERRIVFGWGDAICELEFDGRWYYLGIDDHPVDRITLDESPDDEIDLPGGQAPLPEEGARLRTSPSPLRLLASHVKYEGEALLQPPNDVTGEKIVENNVAYYRSVMAGGLVAEDLATNAARAYRMFDLAVAAGWYERKGNGYLPQDIRGLYRQGSRLWMGSNGAGILVYDTKATMRRLAGWRGHFSPAITWPRIPSFTKRPSCSP